MNLLMQTAAQAAENGPHFPISATLVYVVGLSQRQQLAQLLGITLNALLVGKTKSALTLCLKLKKMKLLVLVNQQKNLKCCQ